MPTAPPPTCLSTRRLSRCERLAVRRDSTSQRTSATHLACSRTPQVNRVAITSAVAAQACATTTAGRTLWHSWAWCTTCPNGSANRDINVTIAANNSLLGWSRGSTIFGPPGSNPRSCAVANDVYTVTHFEPSSDVDSANVGAFVAKRIASRQLVCHPFQRRR